MPLVLSPLVKAFSREAARWAMFQTPPLDQRIKLVEADDISLSGKSRKMNGDQGIFSITLKFGKIRQLK